MGHRSNLSPDVKELYGPRSFCSSGGAAVYLYTGKVAHPVAAPTSVYFLNGVHTASQALVRVIGCSLNSPPPKSAQRKAVPGAV
jgi:hypothetical protein